MKKPNVMFASMICLSLAVSSCSCDRRGNHAQYPSNPTNGQTYIDNSGNSSVWNAALGYWMITSMVNGRSVQHHYYPSTGRYTDEYDRTVTRPAHIPAASTRSVSTSKVTPKSSASTTNSKSSVSTRSSSGSVRSAGFGSFGRSSSAS